MTDDWQPISTAPKETEVLLYEPPRKRYGALGVDDVVEELPGGIYTGIADKGGVWSYSFMGQPRTHDDYFGDELKPVLWMPMPALPVEDDEFIAIPRMD